MYAEEKSFTAILNKLTSADEEVKLTKDEFTRLRFNMEANLKFLKTESVKGWFWRKWLYRSMLTQYTQIYETHFKEQ